MCSRKLSSLKHRLVVVPSLQALGAECHEEADLKGLPDRELNRGFVYWHWAFESPHEVKVLVRQVGIFSEALLPMPRLSFFHSPEQRTC